MNNKKLIIFDLDGTLYQFKNGTFVDSGLQKIILCNALRYIQKTLSVTNEKAKKILISIQNEYGEEISIAMEEKYGCTRREYFDFVWNVNVKGLVYGSSNTRDMLSRLEQKYDLLLISDAAYVWIQNALAELKISEFFEGKILSGDGQKRKSLGNRFNEISKQFNIAPKNVIVVGDQEKTDIIPAKVCGFKTIHVNKQYKSKIADVNICNIDECEKAIISLV